MKLLEGAKKEPKMKAMTVKLPEELVEEFRRLTKKHGLKQTTILKNAIEESIKDMKKL